MKCPECNSCFDKVIIDNKRYLSCWLCKTLYVTRIGSPKLFQILPSIELNGNSYSGTCERCETSKVLFEQGTFKNQPALKIHCPNCGEYILKP